MADNNQQWDDIEYSDDNSEEFNNEEYSDEEYNEEYNDEEYADDSQEYADDDEYASDNQQKSGGAGKIFVLLLLLILLGCGIFFVPKLLKGGDSNDAGVSVEQNAENAQMNDDSFFDSNSEEGQQSEGNTDDSNFDVSFDDNQSPEQNQNAVENNNSQDQVANEQGQNNTDDLFGNTTAEETSSDGDSIMVSYNKASRLNPFKPPVVVSQDKGVNPYAVINNTKFEIIEPPAVSVEDENLTRLLQTQISGILYDDVSPSAIVHLNNMDYFVKVGDKVAGYTIKSITRDKVQINYNNNSYVASVGQLFTRGYLEQQQTVTNLENKFAGRVKNNN